MRDRDEMPYFVIEREGGGGLGPFILGALVGAGLALLFAPQSGDETQEELKTRALKLKGAAHERVKEAQHNLEGRLSVARDNVQARVESVKEAVESGRKAALDARGDLEKKLERSKVRIPGGIEAAREAGADAEDDVEEAEDPGEEGTEEGGPLPGGTEPLVTKPQVSAPLVPPEPGLGRRAREYLFRVLSKAHEDNIFFMAGAITFNLLMAVVPLILLFIGISGFVLTSRFPDPASVIIPFLLGNLPTVGGDVDLVSRVQGLIDTLVADRTGISLVGFFVLFWVATRLVATVRTVLREIFDFSHGRGIISGKLFDAFMVGVGGILFVLNISITVGLETVEEYGVSVIGLEGQGLDFLRQTTALLLAFGSIWVLFLLVYRYFPPRRIPWRTALTAATFTAVLFEAAKNLFSWYVTNHADFGSVYGSLASVAIIFVWIYSGSVVFILGGQVAQVHMMNRTRRLHTSNPVPTANG